MSRQYGERHLATRIISHQVAVSLSVFFVWHRDFVCFEKCLVVIFTRFFDLLFNEVLESSQTFLKVVLLHLIDLLEIHQTHWYVFEDFGFTARVIGRKVSH